MRISLTNPASIRSASRLPFSLFFVFACLAVFLSTTSRAEDRRIDRTQLVVMSFNAEFLWDGVQPEEGSANFPWKGSSTEALEHMEKIAAVIRTHNPDIVNLVEVENIDSMRLLNDRFLSDRGYKAYLQKGSDSHTGQDVGLLTRIDPDGGEIKYDTRSGRSGSVTKSVSKNYTARFDIGGKKLAVIGLHFLAQPNREDRRLPREAQADAIRSMAQDLSETGWSLIVMGDFNDYDGEALSRDHVDSLPRTNVLASIRALDSSTSSDDLLNVSKLVPKAIRYTAFWDQDEDDEIDAPHEFTSIDHVLVSGDLFSKIQSVEMPHAGHDPRLVSDHFPIVVRFEIDSAAPPPPVANGRIRITRLLPNPSGDENENEVVWLKNFGTQGVSLTGYRLRDSASTEWKLDAEGTLEPGEEKQIRRKDRPMAMNNSGDRIELIDSTGAMVQSIQFGRTDEDEVIEVNSEVANRVASLRELERRTELERMMRRARDYDHKMALEKEDSGEMRFLAESTTTDVNKESKEVVSFRVFYATDRNPTGISGSPRWYGGTRNTADELELGHYTVTFPPQHERGEIERPSRWSIRESPQEHVILNNVIKLSEGQFYSLLRGEVDRYSEKQAFVYIHGFNNTFEDAALRAAQIAYDTKFPGAPILYTWPSYGGTTGLSKYLHDEENAQYTQAHLKAFLKTLHQKTGAGTIHLVAHSLGARALTQTLERMHVESSNDCPAFCEVILAAPDIDREVFLRDIAPKLINPIRRLTIYASNKDRALIASKSVHGNLRLGMWKDGLKGFEEDSKFHLIDASAIDTDLLGHAYTFSNAQLLDDFFYTLNGQAPIPPPRALEWLSGFYRLKQVSE